jgi:RNA polymerase sigma factor (sigma-70 family)
MNQPALAMESLLNLPSMTIVQNQEISATVRSERGRLWKFIRKRVTSNSDAEDILQEVFYELVQAYRLMKQIEEHVRSWLHRVARNRIIDWYRKKKPVAFSNSQIAIAGDNEWLSIEEFLPSPDAGPEASYARGVLFQELDAALEELPKRQREAFGANEIEGRTFRQMSAETGVSEIALRLRKHYAVAQLRQGLRAIYDEMTNTGK